MRRLSAIAAAGLTTACLVGVTPWVAQAHTLDTGVRVSAGIAAEGEDPSPTIPGPTDTPTDTTTSSSSTTEPPTDGGITVTATLPSLPGLPGGNGNGNGHGNGN